MPPWEKYKSDGPWSKYGQEPTPKETPGIFNFLFDKDLSKASPYDPLAAIAKVGQFANSGNQQLAKLGNEAADSSAEKLGAMGVPPVLAAIPGTLAGTAATAYGKATDLLTPQDRAGAALSIIPEANALAEKFPWITKPWEGLKGATKTAIQKSGELYSGIRPESFGMLKKDPEGVLAAARKGMTVVPETNKAIPVAANEAQAAARRAQEAIGNAAEGAGKKYGEMMDWLSQAPENSKEFNVGPHVTRHMDDYLERQAGVWQDPQMSDLAKKEKDTFESFYRRIQRSPDMSPKKVANFLEDITANIKANKGTRLSSHLSELKNSVLDSLPGEYTMPEVIDSPMSSTAIDIKGTRAEYKAAKDMQRDLSKFTNKDDAVKGLRGILRAGGKQADALRAAAEHIPELADAIKQESLASAGADFAPKIAPSFARTGLMGAVPLTAASAAGGNLAAAAALPLIGVGSSPRLTAEILANYGPKAAQAIEKMAANPGVQQAVKAGAIGASNVLGDSPTDAWFSSGNIINPNKSGSYKNVLNGLGLPSSRISGSGKLSLQQFADKFADGDQDKALELLRGNK